MSIVSVLIGDRAQFSAWLVVFFLVNVAACGSVNELSTPRPNATSIEQVVSVTIGPDGKLWRARPAAEFVFIDYSEDLGKTFSEAVAVNKFAKRISASREDRPSIVVNNNGKIYVLFTADAAIRRSSFVSFSADGGRHFSEPVLVSDKASQFKHYQATMAADRSGRPHIFWSDERDRDQGHGNALYFTRIEIADSIKMPNVLVEDSICECCRIAVDFDVDDKPVVLLRKIYDGRIRDHGLVKMISEHQWTERRVTFDNWDIHSCPEHGPALSIGPDNRYHMTWFTQGSQRQGIFYAFSDDKGATLSTPQPIGDRSRLPAHADVLAIGQRVALVWQEFDGDKMITMARLSDNQGKNWSSDRVIADSTESADYPVLISDRKNIFVSWNLENTKYRLIPLR